MQVPAFRAKVNWLRAFLCAKGVGKDADATIAELCETTASNLAQLLSGLKPEQSRDVSATHFKNLEKNLQPHEIEVRWDWWGLPFKDFVKKISGEGIDDYHDKPFDPTAHPRDLLGRFISTGDFLELGEQNLAGAVPMDIWPIDKIPAYRIGETMCMKARMPVRGRLSVLAAASDDHGRWYYWAIDRNVGVEKRTLERSDITGYCRLPYPDGHIPIYGPAGDCAMVAIAYPDDKALPWTGRDGHPKAPKIVPLEADDLVTLDALLDGCPDGRRAVSVAEYRVIA